MSEFPQSMKIKLILLGEQGVGKTSFCVRYAKQKFIKNPETIGMDYFSKEIVFHGNPFTIELWDTAGQERYNSICKSFFRDANGVLFVNDNLKTLSNLLNKWDSMIVNYCPQNIKKMLILSKCDIQNYNNMPNKEIEQKYKIKCQKVSALHNINIEKSIDDLIMRIVHNSSSNSNKSDPSIEIHDLSPVNTLDNPQIILNFEEMKYQTKGNSENSNQTNGCIKCHDLKNKSHKSSYFTNKTPNDNFSQDPVKLSYYGKSEKETKSNDKKESKLKNFCC